MKNKYKLLSNISVILFGFLITACDPSEPDEDTPDLTTASVTVIPGTTTFSENAGSGNFSIVLDSQPDNNVIVNIESQDITEAVVSPAQLIFDANSWNVAQNVALTGQNDNSSDGNQTFPIALIIDSQTTDTTGYADLLPGQVSDVIITVTDDDSPGITLTQTQLSFSENGGSGQFEVMLNSQPDGSVIIHLNSDDPAAMSFDINQLSFNETSWNTPQTITVIGIDNSLSSGNTVAVTEFNIDVSSTDTTGYKSLTVLPVVTVTLTDDDAPGVTLIPVITSFSENAGEGSINIVLNSQPNADVVLSISSGDTNEVSISNQTITFTSNNWDQQQTVNLLGVDDNLVDGNKAVDITVSIDPSTADSTGFAQLASQLSSVTVTDDDIASVTILNPVGTTVTEAAGASNSITLSVALNTQPDADVIIDVTSSNLDRVLVSSNQLTYTSNDWSTAQIITVSAIDNFLDDGDGNYSIQFTINGGTADTTGYLSVTLNDVLVSVIDNDTSGITVEPVVSSFTENTGQGSINITLNSQPDNNVEVTFASSNVNDVSVNNPAIAFTPQNWSVTQVVNLTGINNEQADGDRVIEISSSVTSTLDTTGYATLSGQITNVTVTDDDVVGVTLSTPAGTTTTEATGSLKTIALNVVLNTQPDNTVIIDVINSDTTELTVDSSQLTFTDTNWNIPQTLNITAIDDAIDDGDSTIAIQFSVNASSLDTTGYLSVNINDTLINVTNDDTRNVIISPASLTINEGASDSFNIKLNSEPIEPVTIDFVATTNSDEVTLPAALIFNSSNWNISQPYLINVVDDAILDGDVIVSLSVSITTDIPSDYTGLTVPAVNVTTVDTHPVPITLYNAGTSNGNLGGRSGADATCATVAPTIAACMGKPNVHAFLTSSTSDYLKDMPANYGYNSTVPVQGPTGTVISSNWAEMFTTPSFTGAYLQQSLASAAVLPANQVWWSGTRNTGVGYTFATCTGFTTSSSAVISYVGTSSNSDIRWVWKGIWNTPSNFIQDESYHCANTSYLVCSCGK